jgi:hypothetical protein
VELLEDGIAVTKIPFKVGSGSEPTEAAAAGTSAARPAGSEESEAAEPEEPGQAAAAREAPEATVSAVVSGGAGFPAAQATKWPGITVQVTEMVRKGKSLNAKLRFTNSGTERLRPAFYYANTYAIDGDSRKYEVLKDEKGTYVGSLGTGYNDWWGEYLDPGATVLVWMRFPVPAAGVNAVTIQLDGMDPIEDVTVQN